MKRKLCIIVCFIFVLGFSGMANAGYWDNWDIQKLSRPVFFKAYKDAPVERNLNIKGLGIDNRLIPRLREIKETYLELAKKPREPNNFWDRIRERQTIEDRGKALRRIWSQVFDRGSRQTKIDIFKPTTGTSPSPVPEPGTILLMGIGLVGLAGYGRRRINKH